MNESEMRRRELLEQTRNLYREENRFPAIHPRYGNVYDSLYNDGDTPAPKSTFALRLMIGILCFICYVVMDYENIDIVNVSSQKIAAQIEKQTDIQAVWKHLDISSEK